MQNGKRANNTSGKMTRKRINGIILTGLAILAVAFPITWGIVSNYQAAQLQSAQTKPAPAMRLKDLEGKPIDLTELKGKVVFVNFWATWCAPCIAEMPSIERASQQLPAERIAFLLASNEPVDRITSFIERRPIKLPFAQLENQEELGIQVLPATFIIDAKGQLAFSEVGSREWDSAENLKLINEIINK
jgi:thiol-disulfide isomerase/thioredoxin